MYKDNTQALYVTLFLSTSCLRSSVKACNNEAEPNFYGKSVTSHKTIILQVVKMNQLTTFSCVNM